MNVKSGRKSKLLNINQVFLSGNVVADAELRYTKTGKPVLTFRMATNKYVNEVQTSYHNIVCWVDAEVYSGLRKGDFVAVAGELRSRSYEDKTGTKRYVTEVVAQNLTYGLKQNESQSNFEGYGEEEERIPF